MLLETNNYTRHDFILHNDHISYEMTHNDNDKNNKSAWILTMNI